MITKKIVSLAAATVAAFGVASAAVRVEPLLIQFTEGDGAGTSLRGSLTFDDSNLQVNGDGGFTVDAGSDALTVEFPLLMEVVATEEDDFEFPDFPRATFDDEGALVDLEFIVLNTDLLLEVFADLSFFFEMGPSNAPTAVGFGKIRGGVAAVPVPAAALLFAPLAGAMLGRRFIATAGR